jgi:hypothetical protein
MADKHLTEVEWKRFAKGRGLRDAPLVKALAALEVAGRSGGDELAALEEIERQSQTLRRSVKDDKEVSAYLNELDATLDRRLPSARAAAKSHGKAGAEGKGKADGGEPEGEADEALAILTTGLIALLRQVRKGETMQAMIVTDGAQLTAAMLSRRPIPSTRSKVLKDYLELSAAKPPILGQCLLENDAITFVVQTKAAGLAKKLKAALFAQTEMRWKVRVRGADPDDIDEDLEDAVEDAIAPAGEGEPPPQALHEAGASPALAPLLAGMNKLKPVLMQLITERPALRAELLGRVSAFQAGVQAVDAAGAREALFELASLVRRLEDERTTSDAASGKVAFEKIHLDWDGAKKTVHERLAALNAAILSDEQDDQAPTAAAKLERVLARFDEGLGATLDALRNAAPGEQRHGLATKAGTIADHYLAYLAEDPLIAHVERNPFEVEVDARRVLSAPLSELKSQLAAMRG